MAEPLPPKRIPLRSLLTVLLVGALIGWQLAGARNPAPLAEIRDADNALAGHNEKLARREFERLIAQAPDTPVVYGLIVGECLQRKRADLGMVYAYRAIDACKYAPNSSRAELYVILSDLYLRQGGGAGQEMAQAYAHRAFELDPENAQALNAYGYALLESTRSLHEINLALGYIQKALQTLRAQPATEPGILASVEDSYGWGLMKRGQYNPGDYALAVNVLQQALEDVPESASGQDKKVYYYHLGAAYRQAGRFVEARNALQIALFYDPGYPDALKEMQALPPAVAPVSSSMPEKPAASSAAPSSASIPKPLPTNAPSAPVQGIPAFKPLDPPRSKP